LARSCVFRDSEDVDDEAEAVGTREWLDEIGERDCRGSTVLMFPASMYAGKGARDGSTMLTGWGVGSVATRVSGGAITSLKWYLAASQSLSRSGPPAARWPFETISVDAVGEIIDRDVEGDVEVVTVVVVVVFPFTVVETEVCGCWVGECVGGRWPVEVGDG
jgi:hypothetical protein